jgi:outer membrane protein insertion porin family
MQLPILVLLLSTFAVAQNPDGPFPVKVILVKGNKIVKSEQVAAAAGILPGTSVRPADMDRAMQKLLSCGYFDRVSYRYEPREQGYAIEWDVTEVTVFYPIAFEEISAKPAEAKAILAKIDPLFGDKIPATQEVLKRYEDELNNVLKPASPEDRIRGQLAADDKGNLVALFRPKRTPPSIYQVDFTGNQLIRSEELRPIIAAASTGVIYKESDFRDILDIKIRPMYEARGRLKVSFPEILVEKAPENMGVNLKVKVVEGEEYTLGEIRLEGESGRTEDWLRIGGFRQGITANMGEVDDGRRKMELAVKRNGFLDGKVLAKRTINEERKTVEMDFTIVAGEKYTFDKLDIKGLDLISEPEVRKLWGVKKGASFNPDYPDFFLNKLREDGIFDNLGDTKSIADINREYRTVAVTLVFKGAPPKKDDKAKGPRSPF